MVGHVDVCSNRTYRGLCRLIECTSTAGLPLSPKQQTQLLTTLNDNLGHPKMEIQAAAVPALRAFLQAYVITTGPAAPQQVTQKYLSSLQDANVAVRRGSAMALGVLPRWLLLSRAHEVIKGLASATQVRIFCAL